MDYFLKFNLDLKLLDFTFCHFESLNHTTHDSLSYIVHILSLIKFIFQEQQTLPATLQTNYFNQGIYEDIFRYYFDWCRNTSVISKTDDNSDLWLLWHIMALCCLLVPAHSEAEKLKDFTLVPTVEGRYPTQRAAGRDPFNNLATVFFGSGLSTWPQDSHPEAGQTPVCSNL